MFKLSRFILCILIVVSYLYKSVCSSEQLNDNPNDTWKRNNSQDLNSLIGLINLLTINDDNSDSRHTSHIVREQWTKSHRSPQETRVKRPTNDLSDSSSQFYDELLNIPLQHWDLGKLDKYPLLKEFIIRLLSNLEDNRNHIYTPRPGRDAHNDDCIEIVRFRPPFAPRLGKKSIDSLSPRLGRQCSELADRRK